MNSKDYELELKYASGAALVSDGTGIEGYASLFGSTAALLAIMTAMAALAGGANRLRRR